MTTAAVFIVGGLATHARGKTLEVSFGARSCEGVPDAGLLLVLGSEFQSDADRARGWIDWTLRPGRVLVLVPPFGREPCGLPVQWEARRVEPLAGGETDLGKLLARERKHEIRGQLLPLERYAGQVLTAGWRKHPTAGMVAITSLPIWSLTVLDHRAACAAWASGLLGNAGTPLKEDPGVAVQATTTRDLTADEWTLLLHLCTGPFKTGDEALEALKRSTIHGLPPERAKTAWDGVVELGLAKQGALTAAGDERLLGGPYAPYARALRRQHER